MGEVVDLFSKQVVSAPITHEELEYATHSPSLRETVIETFVSHGGTGLIQGVSWCGLVQADPEEHNFGSCDAVTITVGPGSTRPTKERLAIATSSDFPQFLCQEAELDRSDAVDIAAKHILSLMILTSSHSVGLISRKVRISQHIAATRNERLWRDNRIVRSVVNHAASAYVAISGTEFSEGGFDFSQPLPYPDHIASMADPVSKSAFKELAQTSIMI